MIGIEVRVANDRMVVAIYPALVLTIVRTLGLSGASILLFRTTFAKEKLAYSAQLSPIESTPRFYPHDAYKAISIEKINSTGACKFPQKQNHCTHYVDAFHLLFFETI
jgi:hypothetical protein